MIPQYNPPVEENNPTSNLNNPEIMSMPQTGYQGKNYNDQNKTNKPTYQGTTKIDPLINLQVYQQNSVRPPMPKLPQPPIYIDAEVNNPYNTIMKQYPMQNLLSYHPIPSVNQYYINLDGMGVNQDRIASMYEHAVPKILENEAGLTSITERLELHDVIRSTMFPEGDGKSVGLTGKHEKTVLQHIKLLDMKPYGGKEYAVVDNKKNPFFNLPMGFLMFRTCYPIRYDGSLSSVKCAKNSTGMNMRIYMTRHNSITESNNSITNSNNVDDYKRHDHEEWREVAYYLHVYINILKAKACPNFVMLYGYYLCVDSDADLGGHNFYEIAKQIKTARGMQSGFDLLIPKDNKNSANLNPKSYCGDTIVILTETPTYNIIDWMASVFQDQGSVKKGIKTGSHSVLEWQSILFQIMSVFYCLEKNNIAFTNFIPEDFIFIKKYNQLGSVTKYWKYVIDGIEYFVPNTGYSILFDVRYGGINNTADDSPKPDHNILMDFDPDKDPLDDANKNSINNKIKDMFKTVFNDTFTNMKLLADYGGVAPPQEIKDLLNEINGKIDDESIVKIIEGTMNIFVNNRIGTPVRESEVINMRDYDGNVKKGDMIIIIENEGNNEIYKFGLNFTQKNQKNSDTIDVLTKSAESEKYERKEISRGNIKKYSAYAPIQQLPKQGMPITDDDIIETYRM